MSNSVHYFDLDFYVEPNNPIYASFPFYYNDNPVNGISCIISSINSGDMKYDTDNKNRISFFKKLNIDPRSVYGLKQIHCQKVLVIDKNNPPSEEADGMVTQDSSVVLSVTAADCLPVFLFDGTGIAIEALKLMNKKWGIKASDTAVVIGPCIDSCCYKVNKERYLSFAEKFGADSVREQNGSYFLDLKNANIQYGYKAGFLSPPG